MSELREIFEMRAEAFGDHPFTKFMLENCRSYQTGPQTYVGERGIPKLCFMNSARLALENPAMIYVEGQITIHGIPIDHAWCVDADGLVIDPTLVPDEPNGTAARIGEYFGVPFKTLYVRKAALVNGYYGSLLSVFYAHATMPKLIELGLEAGQQWLLDNPIPAKKKKGRR